MNFQAALRVLGCGMIALIDDIQKLIPSEPYLRLMKRVKVATWNKWFQGEMSHEDQIKLAQEIRLNRLPDPGEPINFSDVDFTDEGNGISFEGAELGERVNFGGAMFGPSVNFKGAIFGDGANFKGVTFKEHIVGNTIDFSRARFGDDAKFDGVNFLFDTNFEDVIFGGRASFARAVFSKSVWFRNAVFKKCSGSENWVLFNKCIFQKNVSFYGVKFKGEASFEGAEFKRAAYFEYASFESDAHFDDVAFSGSTLFANAQFFQVPDFEGCNGEGRFDVTGLSVSFSGTRPRYLGVPEAKNKHFWTTSTDVPTRLRRFRKLMDDIKAQDIERDLFILERKAERGVMIEAVQKDPSAPSPLGRIVLLCWFQFLSNCGRSANRPFWIFVFTNLFFFFPFYLSLYAISRLPALLHSIFWWLLGSGPFPKQTLSDLFSFMLGHALPLASMSKAQEDVMTRLFGVGAHHLIEMPFWFGISSMLQSLIGALLLFLFLQAIRNHFRLR